MGATQRLKAVATEVPACKGEQNRTKITLGLAESDHKSSLKSAWKKIEPHFVCGWGYFSVFA